MAIYGLDLQIVWIVWASDTSWAHEDLCLYIGVARVLAIHRSSSIWRINLFILICLHDLIKYCFACLVWLELSFVVHLQTGDKREVLHFHYTTWPDFGVPTSPTAFLNFLKEVREAGALSPEVGPAVIHCSAGIGRSGTFCLADSCLVMVRNGLYKILLTYCSLHWLRYISLAFGSAFGRRAPKRYRKPKG